MAQSSLLAGAALRGLGATPLGCQMSRAIERVSRGPFSEGFLAVEEYQLKTRLSPSSWIAADCSCEIKQHGAWRGRVSGPDKSGEILRVVVAGQY